MANTVIKISEKKINGDWCNITTADLKEVSVNMKSSPKTAALINEGKTEIELNLVKSEKDGKWYGWDKQEAKQGGGGGFKTLTPDQMAAKQQREDHTQRMIVAQSCYAATCNLKQQSSVTHDDVLAMTKKAYNFIMDLSQ